MYALNKAPVYPLASGRKDRLPGQHGSIDKRVVEAAFLVKQGIFPGIAVVSEQKT